MYVLGHVVTAGGPVVGDRVTDLMLPDLLSCHDWAYAHSWYRTESARDRLVVAHMIGDAVVHFGRNWDGSHRRRGWAYLRMGQVTRRYEEFWRTAGDNGWRLPETDRDSRRGWAHTLCEYSIDQYIADRGDWTDLLSACRQQAEATIADRGWVDGYLRDAEVTPSKPPATQPYRYCGALARARTPDEIHLRGLAVKFGLVESDEVLAWLRDWTRGIVRGVGADEIGAVIAEIADTVTDPAAFGYPTTVVDAGRIPDPQTSLAPGRAAQR